ncbi:MAG: hypothetical protein ACI4S9_07370 [Christensenellales bacterium]
MEKKENFLKKAFREMGESARAQHEVDKANFQAVKAESRANFEENRFTNSLARAKANAKESWEDAKLSPSQRHEKMQAEREAQLREAKERIELANARYESVKVNKK